MRFGRVLSSFSWREADGSSAAKPAARPSWSMKGNSALSWWEEVQK
jgi:hypothetical protein